MWRACSIGTVLALCLVGYSIASAPGHGAKPSSGPKKLIYYGWDMPDTEYLRDHCSEMEKMPFDGVGVTVALDRVRWREGWRDTENRLGWAFTGRQRFSVDQFRPAIEDLRAARCQRFTEQFLEVTLSSSSSRGLSWFDDQRWSQVEANVRVIAQIAKAGHARGLVIDPEHYAERLFDYSVQSKQVDQPFADFRRVARRRGQQVIAAVSEVFPEARIFSLFGYTLALKDVRRGMPLERSEYALLPSFFDGILEGLSSEAEFIDGYEFSYSYKQRAQFLDGYRQIREDAVELSAFPELYRRKVRAGFGVWVDYRRNPGYFQPEELEAAVLAALGTCDRYVWIYGERVGFFPPHGIGPKSIEALERATRHAGARN